MSNPFVNFLDSALNGSGNLRDPQHASRLYVNGTFALAPKAGWIYYVVVNINRNVSQLIKDPVIKKQFDQWMNRYNGSVGLLAKTADLPKFTIDTEVLNQYNKKTLIQKQIRYNPISITFHDDMSNVTTDLWKHYYQYYYADGISNTQSHLKILPKYKDEKYNAAINYRYGLNNAFNNPSEPFFESIDMYQLHRTYYTSFKIVNPIIKDWSHDMLDQSQGNKMMTSKMVVDYETVIYNTAQSNKITLDTPGFAADHYDNTPSPLSVNGQGTVSVLGPGGLISGADDIFGTLSNLESASPLDLLNTAISANNVIKNASKLGTAGIKQEGYSILTGALGNISATPASVVNADGTVSKVPAMDRVSQGINSSVSGIQQAASPSGINLYTGNNSSVNNQTTATPKVLK